MLPLIYAAGAALIEASPALIATGGLIFAAKAGSGVEEGFKEAGKDAGNTVVKVLVVGSAAYFTYLWLKKANKL